MIGDAKLQSCFSTDYFAARERFRAALADNQGRLDVRLMPRELAGDERSLSTDIGWVGSAQAVKVFVSISGTHGQEFFAGSAAQLAWLEQRGAESLPEDVAICFVHAHNPYGAVHNSRGNENFVDLNRNFFEPGTIVRPNPLYGELYDLLFTRNLDDETLTATLAGFYDFVERNDTKAAITAMGGGQNTHPTGTLFCGNGDEWSTANLRELVSSHLSGRSQVALIDWHTGLGDYGDMTVYVDEPVQSERYRWACAWWGGPAAYDAMEPVDTRADHVGQVQKGMAQQLRDQGCEAVSAVVEFGTVENEAVLGALLIDRWLRFECEDIHSPHAVRLRTLMMERLNPTLPSWRKAVLEKALTLYDKTIAGLASWTIR